MSLRIFSNRRAFTLVELLVVILVLGVLLAIALPVFLNSQNSAKDADAKSGLNTVYKAMKVDSAKAEGDYPNDESAARSAIQSAEPGLYAKFAAAGDTTPADGEYAFCSVSNSGFSVVAQSKSGKSFKLTATRGTAGFTVTEDNCAGTGSGGSGGTTYSLTINESGSGSASASGTSPYSSGSSVTITATPNSNQQISSWGGACSGTPASSTTCIVSMTENKTVEVNFTSWLAAGAYDNSVLADNPIGYWRLGDDGGHDFTGNGNNVTLSGGSWAPQKVDALAGGSEGATNVDSSINAYNSAPNPGMSDWTMEGWFKVVTNTSGSTRYLASWTNGTKSVGIGQIGAAGSYNKIVLTLDNSSTVGTYIVLNRVLTPGTTYHIVWSNPASGGSTLYIDGSPVSLTGSAKFVNGPNYAGAATSIPSTPIPAGYTTGSSSAPSSFLYQGVMDNRAFYGTALSEARVDAHYDARNN